MLTLSSLIRIACTVISFVLLYGLPLYAQMPPVLQSRVQGRITDGSSGLPIRSASVYMKHLADGSIAGDVADSLGNFTVNLQKAGSYYFAVSYLGYAKYKDTVNISAAQVQTDIGNIKLQASVTKTSEVSVEAEREQIELTPEKKVFNVEKNATVAGGTAADVLRQTPTVDVDMNGNISLRGSSNLVIQVNGKQVGFAGSDRAALLQQLPANLIEKVEVITNPSARYDAEGMAGIINIITKATITQSWLLTLQAGAGTNEKYNASADIAYKDGPFSFSANYGIRYTRLIFASNVQQHLLYGEQMLLKQATELVSATMSHFGSFNIDYSVSDKSTLNLSGQARFNDVTNTALLNSSMHEQSDAFKRAIARNTLQQRFWRGGDLGAGFKQIFSTPQHYLDISTRYSYTHQTLLGTFEDEEVGPNGARLASALPSIQHNNQINQFQLWTVQGDYVQMTGLGKLETGVKSTLRMIDNDAYLDSMNIRTREIIINRQATNRFTFSDHVLAGYGVLGTKLFGASVQAGLRVEHTLVRTHQLTTGEQRNYSYTHLFPTLHCAYKLDTANTLTLSYSRRINRPGFSQLNPFPDYSNPNVLTKGNPDLQPETIDAVESSFMTMLNQHTLTATAYWRRTSNAMQFTVAVDSTRNISILSFHNLNTAENMGMELVYRGQLTRWWTLTANVNVFYNSLQGASEVGNVSAGVITYNARAMTSFKMPWEGGNLQANYMYNGPSLFAQGMVRPFHALTLGYRQDVGRDWSIALNVSDVFDTQRFTVDLAGSGFTGNASFKPETRIGNINITYRFGGMQGEQPRRRRDGGEIQEGGGGLFGM